MIVDKAYWASDLPRPLSPNNNDVAIYIDNMIDGSVLLLGCTKKLIPVSNFQLDKDPWYNAPGVIVGNWLENKIFYDNIIGDGVLNLSKELCNGILEMCSTHCKKLIARTFTRRLQIMKVASHFPKSDDFNFYPSKIIELNDYSFYIWCF